MCQEEKWFCYEKRTKGRTEGLVLVRSRSFLHVILRGMFRSPVGGQSGIADFVEQGAVADVQGLRRLLAVPVVVL